MAGRVSNVIVNVVYKATEQSRLSNIISMVAYQPEGRSRLSNVIAMVVFTPPTDENTPVTQGAEQQLLFFQQGSINPQGNMGGGQI